MIELINELEYTIVRSDSSFDLSKTVNEYIQRGWKPQGGMAVNSGFGTFYQAMVKNNV